MIHVVWDLLLPLNVLLNNPIYHHLYITHRPSIFTGFTGFMKNGGRVHCVALDATKAFDKISHHGLFYKMLCKGVPVIFVKLLTPTGTHIC